jgi:hypothetical protein
MRKIDTPSVRAPRYLRATALTVIAVSVLPALFMALGWADYYSPDWDPKGDSGAVQGLAFFSGIAAFAITFAAGAFPATAAFLWKQGRYEKPQFYKVLRIWLAIPSLVAALAISALSGSLLMFIPIGLLFFCVVALLAFPFAPLWFWLSQ